MPEKVTLNDGKDYIEYSFKELEERRLNSIIADQVKHQRPTRTESVFNMVSGTNYTTHRTHRHSA